LIYNIVDEVLIYKIKFELKNIKSKIYINK